MNAARLKIEALLFTCIFLRQPPPPRLHSHSLRPKSFSSCFCAALRGDELKIEVFPRHVTELFPSVSNPPLPLSAPHMESSTLLQPDTTHTHTHESNQFQFTICSLQFTSRFTKSGSYPPLAKIHQRLVCLWDCGRKTQVKVKISDLLCLNLLWRKHNF